MIFPGDAGKDEIKPMDKVSEVILGLKPVTFRYKRILIPKRYHSLASSRKK